MAPLSSSRRKRQVTIGVTLSGDERDDLAAWARDAGVSMSTYLRWKVQDEATQRFYCFLAHCPDGGQN